MCILLLLCSVLFKITLAIVTCYSSYANVLLHDICIRQKYRNAKCQCLEFELTRLVSLYQQYFHYQTNTAYINYFDEWTFPPFNWVSPLSLWPSGKPSDCESGGPGFNPHMVHRVVSLSNTH